jgi:hypothetical protein
MGGSHQLLSVYGWNNVRMTWLVSEYVLVWVVSPVLGPLYYEDQTNGPVLSSRDVAENWTELNLSIIA